MSNYGKLCTMIYDLDKPYAAKEETEIYSRIIKSKNDKILEPMCGSGRFYVPFLEDGYDITGFDLSEDMLEACKRKCFELGIKPNVFKADMVHYQCSKKYKYIFIPVGSISLLISENDLYQSLFNMYNCMESNGIFVFSYLGPESKSENINEWREVQNYAIDDKKIVCKQKSKYINESDILNIKLLYELIQNEVVIENEYQNFPVKLFTEKYLKKILGTIGFSEIEPIKSSNSENDYNILKCVKL
ncbi:methyltransferase domain-containing protein [Patescibacteria group bacterium]|nr:methyltransferase domain-containing protein [Patescibacteria group bacterium]